LCGSQAPGNTHDAVSTPNGKVVRTFLRFRKPSKTFTKLRARMGFDAEG
jgi:hypothetical protein